MKPPTPPPSGGDGWLYAFGAVFFGAALVGGFISAWDAGREYGMREERRRALLKQLEEKEHGTRTR